ncbi:MAG: DUF3298 domain-containing protein [Paludibacteraceae bacterium]|nr:DUF3298 domain-containing protein [Paludibacteraceae bacterium]
MKRLIVSLLTVSSLLFFFNSCKENCSLEFLKVDHTKVLRSPLANDTTKGYCKVDIQFLYPIAGVEDSVLKKIQHTLLLFAFDTTSVDLNPKASVNDFVQKRFDEYTLLINQTDSNTVLLLNNQEWILNTLILFNDMGILSYEINKYERIGRDIRKNITQYLVFDLKTGKKLSERDIFEDGYEAKVTDLLKKQIMLDNGFESEEQMINNGYFFAMNIVPNHNFNVTENGISYVFNPDEIAVYSMGQTEVLIPFNKLKSCLKKDSPIEELLKK